MPDIIQLLPPLIANQIAAGEVIERSASIIKELIENSLDAGSTQITVNIKKSGNNLIIITDNGCGISKNDLPLAIRQHATSKLKNLMDLENIKSLGFRGEALASVCAVAKVKITSREVTCDTAYSIIIDGNCDTYKVTLDAHPIGTTIEVRDLFYNIPVRKRFLKSDKTELQHVIEIFQKLALSNFNCSFTLLSDDKVIYKLLKTNINCQYTRVQKIFGKSFIDNSVYFTSEGTGIKLQGWLGKSDYHRSQTDHQYFFLNDRIIRDKLILHAIKYVYESIIPEGRHPCYILYLYIDPTHYDINVHPTKHEVRFSDGRWIHQFLIQQLSKVLLENKFPDPLGDSDYQQVNNKIFDQKSSFTAPVYQAFLQQNSSNSFGNIIGIINNNFIITHNKLNNKYFLINLNTAYTLLSYKSLCKQWHDNKELKSHDLNIKCSLENFKLNSNYISNLNLFGMKIDIDNNITAVPYTLRYANPKDILEIIYLNLNSQLNEDLKIASLFKQLAVISIGRLAGNLLISEQNNILDNLANIQYDQLNFDNNIACKELTAEDLELFLKV